MADFVPTERTRLRRKPDRGSYDRDLAYAILDEALSCHLGYVEDGHPVVIPTLHWRDGDALYVHGSSASHALRAAARDRVEVCLTVTLLDGLVLARSGFHHSLNYRSVIAFGQATALDDDEAKARALDALVEHVAPGRAAEVRAATAQELKATTVLRLPLEEVSVKVRSGGVNDEPDDLALPIWAGVVPMALAPLAPEPDPANLPGVPLPPSV